MYHHWKSDVEPELAAEFLNHIPANFLVRYDPDSQAAREFGLKGMPSSYLFNRQGELVSEHVGFALDKTHDYEQSIVYWLSQH